MKDSKQRVAVIGGGVSGLASAWHLQQQQGYEVHLWEAQDRLGGHAWTVPVMTKEGKAIDVDIGFMVFNHSNYPNMVEWFKALQVPEEDSDMSLSVSLDQGNIEWNSYGCIRDKRHVLQYYSMIRDMLRFHEEAPALLRMAADDPRKHVTTGQYLRDHRYSTAFCKCYLLPMMAALWSASMEDVLNFPAAQLIAFLCNHKMLQLLQRPQWKTVAGRSQQYVQAVEKTLEHVHLSTPIGTVRRASVNGYELLRPNGEPLGLLFDQVIFACHPPNAAQMLESFPSLKNCLSQIRYEDNTIYIHSDPKLMPVTAWASWNCLGKSSELPDPTQQIHAQKGDVVMEGSASGFGNKITHDESNEEVKSPTRMKAVYVTYWLNRLQNLDTSTNIFVSLNPHQAPESHLTHHRVTMAHPQFTQATLQARDTIAQQFQGQEGLWFCGAWQGYGFHEDGCRAGFAVATELSGVPLPWAQSLESSRHVLEPPDLSVSVSNGNWWKSLHQRLRYDWPVAICKRFIFFFLRQAVQKGTLRLKMNDGSMVSFGDGTPCGRADPHPVTLRVFDEWFFVKTAFEYDLGLARSYMAGHFVVEPLKDKAEPYHPVLKPANTRDETTVVLGDPVGLTRLFLLFIGNRDRLHEPRRSGRGHNYSNAMSNASGLLLAKIGSFFNYMRYKLTMDNSERGGSLKNIHAHYDISNDLFRTFLDNETLMYSSAIYNAIPNPVDSSSLRFRGTLEEAQWRKLDTLLERAQIQPGQTMLDIGFGWGGLSLHAAKKYGCRVTGITLSVEQKALAEVRVKEAGLERLITFEVIDYRAFCRRKENRGKFDRVLSCEMIEAVGHEHLGEFFWAVEQVLAKDGILVMEAITTPEQRYETYLRSTDFINTIIFPGSCCPSLHALVDAAYRQSCLTLEHIDNIGLHYAQTLAEWRRRFNASEAVVRQLGFDDVFLRCWNYYLTYCEAGFFSQTENCLILVFSRQGCSSLIPLCETRSVMQVVPLTLEETRNWLQDS